MSNKSNGAEALHELMSKPPLFEANSSVAMDDFLEIEEEQANNEEVPTEKTSEQTVDLKNFVAQPVKKAKELVEQISENSKTDTEKTPLEPKVQQRNQVVVKHAVKEYNKIQTGLFIYLLDWMGSPKRMRKRNKELIAKVGSLSNTEQEELKALNEQLEKYELQREEFTQAVRMDEESMEVLIDCATDVFEVEGIEMNPWSVLIFILIMQLLGNSVMLWTYTSKLKR